LNLRQAAGSLHREIHKQTRRNDEHSKTSEEKKLVGGVKVIGNRK
jgi:hypothetical protein